MKLQLLIGTSMRSATRPNHPIYSRSAIQDQTRTRLSFGMRLGIGPRRLNRGRAISPNRIVRQPIAPLSIQVDPYRQ